MKNCSPSLVDVILTNQPQYCFNAMNFGCGISNWHNMIGVVVKGATVRNEKIKIKYRSFKHFVAAHFERDVGEFPFHAAYVFMTLTTYTGPMRGFSRTSLTSMHPSKSEFPK